MRRELTVLLLCIGLVVSGCGGSGGGTAMVDDMEPTPPPVTPPAEEEEEEEMPTELTEHEMAFVRGIVNPSVAADPSTSQPTTAVSRPGQSVSEGLDVSAGGMAITPADLTATPLVLDNHIPKTMLGTTNINASSSPFKKVGSEGTLGSFMSQTYEKQTRGVTDTVTLFSNIDEPKAVLYETYYVQSPSSENRRPGVSGRTAGALTIANDNVPTYGSLFKSDVNPPATTADPRGFPRSGTAIYSVPDGPEHLNFDGTFNGIDGKFTCVTTPCTATANDNGLLTALTGGWQFKPTGDYKMVMVPNASYDSDYLSFGYWISETTTASASRFEVGTVFDGSQPANVVGGLTGTATYLGEAAGAYARKGDNPAVGEFTGHASLTANFGDGEELGTIKGTISQLVDGSELIDQSWTVDLQMATIEGEVAGATFDGRTTGGGNWRGGFFGTPAEASAAESARYPHGVAGDFTGHFENGHVIGAFGATRR